MRWLLGCVVIAVLLLRNDSLIVAQSPVSAAISVAGTAGLATPGGSVTYVLQLYNHTDRPLSDSVIRYTLPDGFIYIPGSTQVTVGGYLLSTADPSQVGATLRWSPFQVPAAGHTWHTPRGIHTMAQDLCIPEFIDLHLDQALHLVGSGGYVTQLFYGITAATAGPDACAIYFVNAAYNRNLVPILRLQGRFVSPGIWEKPDPGPAGDYAAVAQGFARYVAGLPRRDTHPLYIVVWNEPNLWIEWGGAPNAGEYARFFTAVSRAIRRLGDPRIRIVNGAVSPGSGHLNFIRSMLAVPGFVYAFDAWASHCYPYNHPPWYNNHSRNARYGEYAIDCYLLEKREIERYGRSGFKFLITETGYELGDATFAFEGFPSIDERNRADYMAEAFSRWWPSWPEVIAATPFQLGDPWSGWERYDWIDYSVSLNPRQVQFSPRLQYTVVSALSKPRGEVVARSVQVSFQARVTSDAAPGRTYAGTLCGAARDVPEVCRVTALVQVVAQLQPVYLPVIAQQPQSGNTSQDGVWYLAEPVTPVGVPDEESGVVQPTTFLSDGQLATQSLTPPAPVIPAAVLPPDAEWLMWVGDVHTEWVAVANRRGELVVVDLARSEVLARVQLDQPPRFLAAGARAGTLYVASTAGIIQWVDAFAGDVLAQCSDAHLQVSALVYDPTERTLLIADAAAPAVVRLAADLSRPLARQALPDLPGAIQLNAERRRLFVVLPGSNQIITLDATTLQPVARQGLPGGPLLTITLDRVHDRIYGLSAASPRQRVIAVLEAATLRPLALVAGTLEIPLRQATALQVDRLGHLWVAEGERLYGIEDHHRVVESVSLARPLRATMLMAAPEGHRVVWMDPAGIHVR